MLRCSDVPPQIAPGSPSPRCRFRLQASGWDLGPPASRLPSPFSSAASRLEPGASRLEPPASPSTAGHWGNQYQLVRCCQDRVAVACHRAEMFPGQYDQTTAGKRSLVGQLLMKGIKRRVHGRHVRQVEHSGKRGGRIVAAPMYVNFSLMLVFPFSARGELLAHFQSRSSVKAHGDCSNGIPDHDAVQLLARGRGTHHRTAIHPTWADRSQTGS